MNIFEEEIREAREQVRQLANKYHIVAPLVTTKFQIVDKRGKVLDSTEKLAKSWTRNGYNLLMSSLGLAYGPMVGSSSVFGDGLISTKNTSGTIIGTTSYTLAYKYGSYSNDLYIGTGTTAESIDDYALASIIDHGTGSGQMIRLTRSYNTTWYSASRTMRTGLSKAFTNGSGSSIYVTESCITCDTAGVYTTSSSAVNNYVMIQRDVFAAREVENGKTATVFYDFDVVYPAA